jgi:hypothetical protein
MMQTQSLAYRDVIQPAAIIDDASATTVEIDTIGYSEATIIVLIGATDVAMTVLKMQESDTSGSGFADITGLVYGTSSDIDGNTSALPTATDDNKQFIFQIDLRGRKRYLDLVATCGDGTNGTYIAAVCILSRGAEAPNTVSDSGAAGILRV